MEIFHPHYSCEGMMILNMHSDFSQKRILNYKAFKEGKRLSEIVNEFLNCFRQLKSVKISLKLFI